MYRLGGPSSDRIQYLEILVALPGKVDSSFGSGDRASTPPNPHASRTRRHVNTRLYGVAAAHCSGHKLLPAAAAVPLAPQPQVWHTIGAAVRLCFASLIFSSPAVHQAYIPLGHVCPFRSHPSDGHVVLNLCGSLVAVRVDWTREPLALEPLDDACCRVTRLVPGPTATHGACGPVLRMSSVAECAGEMCKGGQWLYFEPISGGQDHDRSSGGTDDQPHTVSVSRNVVCSICG